MAIILIIRHFSFDCRTFGEAVDPKMEAFLKYNDLGRGRVSHGLGTYLFLTLLVLLTLLAKKLRIRVTGRHKKNETDSFPRFPNKYRDS